MQAKVKADYRWNVVTACAGAEFVKRDWRRVPAGREAEADANPLLDTREAATEPGLDLDALTVAELQDLARDAGISYSGLRKAELIEALEAA